MPRPTRNYGTKTTEEILKLSDRIGVIFKGRIVREYSKSDFSFSSDEEKQAFMTMVGKAMIGMG